MSNFLDALSGAARSGACAVLGVPNYINDALESIGFFPFDSARRAIPDFWRNVLCDTPAPEPNPRPFAGGQCPGVLYDVFGYVDSETISGTLPTRSDWALSSFPGAISRRRIREGDFDRAQIVSSTGTILTVGGVNTNFRRITGFEITEIFRVDGLPDDCGDPEPEYEEVEPGDVTINNNITYENSFGVSITVPVTLVYARAQIDARANILIPFTANINGEVNVRGTVNLNGEVEINIGTSVGTGTPTDPRKDPCKDIAVPDGEVPQDPTDSDQPNEPDRSASKVIEGVLVTVTNLEEIRATSILQNENPDIYAPNLGFVNFLIRVGQIQAGWTADIPVKNRRQFIPCPWDSGAIDVKGTPQPGVDWVLTPVVGLKGVPVEYFV